MTDIDDKKIEALIAELKKISHPAARLFPLLIHLNKKEWKKFLGDIASKGQDHRIIRDATGLILDGRNRWLACKILGLDPKFEDRPVSGRAAIEIVMSGNLRRRHERVGPRSIHTASLLEMMHSENFRDIPTQEEAAESADISDASLREAQKLLKDHPEIAEEVSKGKLSLHAGRVLSKADPAEQKQVLEKIKAAPSSRAAKGHVPRPNLSGKRLELHDDKGAQFTGSYRPILEMAKNLPRLPQQLRVLHKQPHQLSVGHATQLKDALLSFKKFDFKNLLSAVDVAVAELNEIIKAGEEAPPASESEPSKTAEGVS